MAATKTKRQNPKKKRNLSPETRQKLSEAAKKRHQEGKLGGAKYGRLGGRPRRDRAGAHVAEAARKEKDEIVAVFKDAVKSNQPIGIRLKGAQAWLEVEEKDAKLALQEEENEAKGKSREELIELLKDKLTKGTAAAILSEQMGLANGQELDENGQPIVDVDFVEIDGDSAG